MKKITILLIASLLLFGCYAPKFQQIPVVTNPTIISLTLPSPFDNKLAEYSGLSLLNEDILLIPQYPERFKEENTEGYFVTLPQNGLLTKTPLECDMIEVIGLDALHKYDGYEGFEAVTVNGYELYFAIEVGGEIPYTLAVKGTYDSAKKSITLDSNSITKLDCPVDIDNASYESVVFKDNLLYFFYEGNGANINPEPYVLVTDTSFKVVNKTSISPIEYRITDVTNFGDDGVLYAINYFWPGDAEKYIPGLDQVTGLENSKIGIERIIPLKLKGNSFVPAKNVKIFNLEYKGRNWEGIARFKDGYLLITDKYPGSEFIYIKTE